MSRPDFTIAFLVNGDLPLLDLVVPTTLAALCGASRECYDLILSVDGAEVAQTDALYERAMSWGFDELRLRWRSRWAASGDKTNNGHFNLVSHGTRFVIVVEGDVAVFSTKPDVDLLAEIRTIFDAHPELAVAQRIDDHQEWVWKLEDAGEPFGAGVRSVNRVSSHFLVYETSRFRRHVEASGGIPADEFHDDGQSWYNYEDWISHAFARPRGPGIGFLAEAPLRVYHCDQKVSPNSVHYRRDLATRIDIFQRRRAEINQGLSVTAED